MASKRKPYNDRSGYVASRRNDIEKLKPIVEAARSALKKAGLPNAKIH